MKQKNKPMTALMDASSAIILYKADLHLIVSEMYNVVMSKSVYDEITCNSYPGAEEYQQLLADNKITIQALLPAPTHEPIPPGLHNLGQGEHDIIQLYCSEQGDFVITDDGAAAKYCKGEQIRFINSLLIPMILKCTGKRSDAYCQQAFNKIKDTGRYAHWVINFAEKCGRDELSFFLP